MKMTRHSIQALALAAIGCLGLSNVKAALVDYQIGNGGLEGFNITYDSTTINGALAGGIAITRMAGSTALPATYTTVCTDVGGTVYLGSTYGYDQTSFANQTGVQPQWGAIPQAASMAIQNAAHIFYTAPGIDAMGLGGTTSQKAAVQLAVWAALYNTGINGQVQGITFSAGNYSLSSGRFTVSSGDQAAINQAAIWLQGLSGNYGLTGNLLYPNPTYQGNGNGEPVQELLIRTQDDPAVPEPTTLIAGALLLLPFGASTLRSLRKNRAA
jgi:hypothetical protein